MLKDLSRRFYRKTKKVAEEKVNNVRRDVATEKTKASEAEAMSASMSSDVIQRGRVNQHKRKISKRG